MNIIIRKFKNEDIHSIDSGLLLYKEYISMLQDTTLTIMLMN
jgi:hypothetical protein